MVGGKNWTVLTMHRLGAPSASHFDYFAFHVEFEGKREWMVSAGCRFFANLDKARKHWNPKTHGEPWKCEWVRRRLDELVEFFEPRDTGEALTHPPEDSGEAAEGA